MNIKKRKKQRTIHQVDLWFIPGHGYSPYRAEDGVITPPQGGTGEVDPNKYQGVNNEYD